MNAWKAAACGVFALSVTACGPKNSGDTAQAPAPHVATAPVSFGAIDVTVPAVGRVGPAAGSETKLAFATSGRIGTVNVHVGDRVSAGEALVSLDAQPLALTAQQADADARAAAAQADAAAVDRTSTKLAVDEAAVARAERLYGAGVTARKDIEAAQAQVAADRADAQTAKASLQAARATSVGAQAKAALAQRDLSNATLRSPIDGVVTAVYRAAGESVDPTVAVIAVAPGSNSQVLLQVAGTDAARVRAGDAVRLSLPNSGGQIEGRVSGVSGAVDPATQSAQILVSAAVPSVLSGSALDAQIVVAHDRGLLVPKSAVIADPASGKTLVFVEGKDKDGNPKFDERDVRVVFQNDKLAEITGVQRGENVAATGAFELLPPAGGGG